MTIITKANTEKPKKVDEKPLVITDGPNGKEYVTGERTDLNGMDVEMWLSPSARRRISTTTTVCVFITALLMMSICIIGGVYLYRQVTQHQRMTRFRGWCGIPYERDTLHFSNQDYLLGLDKRFFQKNNAAERFTPNNRLKQEFDLDLDTELYERIDVPEFGYGRRGRFIHDFEANKTGIIDLTGKQCFVIPLDREHVKPPRSLFDLIKQVWMGYYAIDTKVIHQTMKVVQPPIQDLKTQGTFIAQLCAKYPTFLLVNKNETRIRREAKNDNAITLAEFAGKGILEYTIITEE